MQKDPLLGQGTNVVPLTGGFMITSIVGFLISVFYIFPLNKPWGFTFSVFFFVMFVSSMISMTYAPGEWPYKERKIKRKVVPRKKS